MYVRFFHNAGNSMSQSYRWRWDFTKSRKMRVHFLGVRFRVAIDALWERLPKPSPIKSPAHARPSPHTPNITHTSRRDLMDPSSILKYINDHHAVLCMIYEKYYYIPPNAMRDHLHDLHQDKLTKKQRGELVKFAGSLDLA
jgi:hypothetical protein